MIITQTIDVLGRPDWELKGTILLDAPSDCGPGGYGLSPQTGLDQVAQKLKDAHGEYAHVVGAQIKIGSGGSHPSYGRTHVWVQGDLYIEQVKEKPCPTK